MKIKERRSLHTCLFYIHSNNIKSFEGHLCFFFGHSPSKSFLFSSTKIDNLKSTAHQSLRVIKISIQ